MIHFRSHILSKFRVEDFVSFAGEWLNIPGDSSLFAFYDDQLLDRFGDDGHEYQALLYATALPGTYNLVIRGSVGAAALKNIFAHEMVHLAQYVSGRLKMDVVSRRCVWEGRDFSSDVPYEQRPWEKEAFSQEKELLKAFKKYSKSKKPCHKQPSQMSGKEQTSRCE